MNFLVMMVVCWYSDFVLEFSHVITHNTRTSLSIMSR